jgi:hypothetical protein
LFVREDLRMAWVVMITRCPEYCKYIYTYIYVYFITENAAVKPIVFTVIINDMLNQATKLKGRGNLLGAYAQCCYIRCWRVLMVCCGAKE